MASISASDIAWTSRSICPSSAPLLGVPAGAALAEAAAGEDAGVEAFVAGGAYEPCGAVAAEGVVAPERQAVFGASASFSASEAIVG